MQDTKADSSNKFRGSPLARMLGSTILSIGVVVYLTLITLAQASELPSTRAIASLSVFWALGLFALGILVRGWLKAKSQLHIKRRRIE